TRAFRRRQLPTNHGHAALPWATRVYQPDSSSKTPHPPLRAVALRNSFAQRGSDPPKNSLDGRSFHIRVIDRTTFSRVRFGCVRTSLSRRFGRVGKVGDPNHGDYLPSRKAVQSLHSHQVRRRSNGTELVRRGYDARAD